MTAKEIQAIAKRVQRVRNGDDCLVVYETDIPHCAYGAWHEDVKKLADTYCDILGELARLRAALKAVRGWYACDRSDEGLEDVMQEHVLPAIGEEIPS